MLHCTVVIHSWLETFSEIICVHIQIIDENFQRQNGC